MNFSRKLITWYEVNKRELPWRETNDPYKIWLSEVILQQTRVEQGMPYYLKFIEKYPTLKKLAAAPDDEVMKLWQGLGYYSRARNMLTAAREVMANHSGKFPNEFEEIKKLKGIGPYTAAAIASLAFGLAHAVVDGNVYRVLARIYSIDTPINSTEGATVFAKLATELLDAKNPGTHNQAVMEFGATHCKPAQPLCPDCIFNRHCVALQKGLVTQLPVKTPNAKPRTRHFNYFYLTDNKRTWLQQRTGKDVWQGLYEFPLLESETKLDWATLLQHDFIKTLLGKLKPVLGQQISFTHLLSHQKIEATFFEILLPKGFVLKKFPTFETSLTKLKSYPVSRLTDKFIESIQH